MTLPLFNLCALIRQYNRDDTKKTAYYAATYHEQETFGFSGFEKLKDYQSRLQAINNASDLFLFSKEESDYHRRRILPSVKQLRDRLVQDRRQNTFTTPALSLPKNPAIENGFNQKQRFYHWQTRYHRYLSTLNWANLASSLSKINQRRLNTIKVMWDRGAVFTRCTNEALVFLAEQLPMLIQDYQALKEELTLSSKSFKRVPPAIQEAYRHHLTDVVTEAKNLTEKLAAILLAKLQIWDATQGKNSTLFLHIHDRLKMIGIDTPQPPDVNDPYLLTVDHFLRFHRFSEQYGTHDIKRQLKQLSWFQCEAALPLRFFETEEGQFLIPASLERYVPFKRPYFSWLFRGEALRYDYFKAKTLSLASLRRILRADSEDSGPMTYAQAQEYLNVLQSHEKIIRDLMKELENPPYSTLSFLFLGTRTCFKQWYSELSVYQTQLLEKKIHLVEKMIQSVGADCEKWRQDSQGVHLTGIPVNWNTCTQIEILLIELSLSCVSIEVNHPLIKRIDALQQHFDNIRALNRCFDSLQRIGQGDTLTASDKKYLFQFYAQEHTRNPVAAKSFLAYCHPRIEKAMLHFEHQLKQRPHKNDSLPLVEAHITKLIDYHDIIHQLGDEQQKQQIRGLVKRKLPYFFLRYLEVLVITQQQPALQEEQPRLLDQLETLFFALGDEVGQGESNYHQLATVLQHYRRQHQWHHIEAKANSLMKSLSKKLLLARLEKDCKTLDAALFTCTEQDQAVGYSEAELQQLKAVRDKKVTQQSLGMPSMAARTCLLPRVPRGPLDETHPAVKSRYQFFDMSIRAHQDLKKIQHESDYEACVSTARLLGKQFETLFPTTTSAVLKKEFHPSLLFSKTYGDPEVEKIIIAKG